MDRLDYRPNTCRNCGGDIDPQVARVLGDNQRQVTKCPECIETITAGKASTGYALREMREEMA